MRIMDRSTVVFTGHLCVLCGTYPNQKNPNVPLAGCLTGRLVYWEELLLRSDKWFIHSFLDHSFLPTVFRTCPCTLLNHFESLNDFCYVGNTSCYESKHAALVKVWSEKLGLLKLTSVILQNWGITKYMLPKPFHVIWPNNKNEVSRTLRIIGCEVFKFQCVKKERKWIYSYMTLASYWWSTPIRWGYHDWLCYIPTHALIWHNLYGNPEASGGSSLVWVWGVFLQHAFYNCCSFALGYCWKDIMSTV